LAGRHRYVKRSTKYLTGEVASRRRRAAFLDAYQALLLDEHDSSVGSTLKEAFLVLRRQTVTPE